MNVSMFNYTNNSYHAQGAGPRGQTCVKVLILLITLVVLIVLGTTLMHLAGVPADDIWRLLEIALTAVGGLR